MVIAFILLATCYTPQPLQTSKHFLRWTEISELCKISKVIGEILGFLQYFENGHHHGQLLQLADNVLQENLTNLHPTSNSRDTSDWVLETLGQKQLPLFESSPFGQTQPTLEPGSPSTEMELFPLSYPGWSRDTRADTKAGPHLLSTSQN